jgi:hypothetical protein
MASTTYRGRSSCPTLTPRWRRVPELKLARLVVEDDWPLARAAERFQVAWPTVKRWADRYRAEGAASMLDRSSRPHRSPRATPPRWCAGSCTCAGSSGSARRDRRPGRVRPSTVYQVLVRCRINRLTHVDRATVTRCAATNTPRPAICCTSTSASWATSPTAAVAIRRPISRPPQPSRHRSQAARPSSRPAAGHRVRAHRARQPHPSHLRRDPQRRDRGHRGRGAAPGGGLAGGGPAGGGLVCHPRRHRPPSTDGAGQPSPAISPWPARAARWSRSSTPTTYSSRARSGAT